VTSTAAVCFRVEFDQLRAEILTIGDELCRGEIVDTNSSGLAARLWDLGITTRWMTSCCDDDQDITTALRLAVSRADMVICSGGLGPTEDDLTVDVVARLAGVEAVVDEPARERMAARFAKGNITVTAVDPRSPASADSLPIWLRQLRVPAGARVFANPQGLAPGFEQEISGVPVLCMPGVPREVYGIFDAGLGARLAELRESAGQIERIARRIYRVFGRGESQISQACRGLLAGKHGDRVAGGSITPGPAPLATIHYQVKFPETLVKLVVRDADRDAAEARLAALDADLRSRLGDSIYGTGDENLVDRTARRLIERELTVATAESCTGGMIGELITRMPGSSRVFLGGAIVYSNAEKVRQLGVAQATLDAHGAVSEQTVIEMATGARERFGSQLAVSVSGIAGPDGGTPDKPVGTVWLALASPSGMTTKKLGWPGMRDQIRTLAAWWALKLLDDYEPR
jgi:nicotinamide-nucleotide amidase